MTLTPQTCAEIVRARGGIKDGSQDAKILMQLPSALKAFARRYAADPYTRSLICTDKATTTLAIGANGQVNLITGYDTYQFLKEYIDKGQMYLLSSVTTVPYLVSVGGFASGTWTFARNPVHNETIVVNGVTFTFKQPGLSVSGAGETSMNNPFIYAGQFNDKPFYTLGPIDYYCRWETDSWYFRADDFAPVYLDNEPVDFPWEGTKWAVSQIGSLPVPVVEKGALTSVQVEIGVTAADTALNFAVTLNASADVAITVATYEAMDVVVTGTYNTTGSGGNAFTMASSSGLAVVRSASTFTGGGDNTYGLQIGATVTGFANFTRVRFTTTGSLPTGISLATDYYIINYSPDAISDPPGPTTFGLSTTVTGLNPVTITSAGSGVLTMLQMDSSGNPIQPIRSPQQANLPQYLGSIYQYFYIQGDVLFLLATDGVYPTGSLAFAVPYWPLTLAALPDSDEAERLFIDILTEQSFPSMKQGARNAQ